MRVATSDQLRHLNLSAIREHRNRVADAGTLERLDPEGQHVCLRAMPTGPEDQFIRTWWAVKVMGTDTPDSIVIDADWPDYLALPSTEEVLGTDHPQASG